MKTSDNPIDALFGFKSKVAEFESGGQVETTQRVKDGKVIRTYEHYCEHVKITSEAQVLNEFLAFMDFVRTNRKRFDIDFKLRVDKDGTVYQVEKSWTEVIKA